MTIEAKDPVGFLREQLKENAIDLLTIIFEHTAGLLELPLLPKDLFDHLITTQALHDKVPILPPDAIFSDHGVRNLF